MNLPDPIVVGDIIGVHFPQCPAPYPHPGITIQCLRGDARTRFLAARQIADRPDTHLVLLLMISHAPPGRGQFGEIIPAALRLGTSLDAERSLYVCYDYFTMALMPGTERPIASVGGPYLGRISNADARYFYRQLMEVQAFLRGDAFRLPDRVIRG